MTIHDYLEEDILILTASPIVEHFQIVKRRETESDGYLRVRANLIGEGLLEVSIYCQMAENTVRLVDYRFHWQDREGLRPLLPPVGQKDSFSACNSKN